jgi:putative membrane protein
MRKRYSGIVATLVVALLAWSGVAVAQDTASPNSNQAQSQSEHKRTDATAAENGQNGTKSTEANGNSQLAPQDKKFMMKAAEGGIEEVELGKLVASKTQDNDVKLFAQRMVDDHSKANDELKSLA